jgi:hypothetical protein
MECYSVGGLLMVLLLSSLLSIAFLLLAWTAAFFWVFAMILGNPDGTERKDDGRGSWRLSMVALVAGQSQKGASLTYRVHIPRYFLIMISERGVFGCPTGILHPRVSLFGMIPMFGICEMTWPAN